MKKINVAELLKDCPKGMELDCTMFENVEFDYIEQSPELAYPIHCITKTNGGYNALVFTHNGCNGRHPNAKCVIFPKGKTTWEGFVPPCQFKDGDIIFIHTNASKGLLENSWVSIFKEYRNNRCACYACLCLSDLELYHDKWEDELLCELCEIEESSLATEEEKQKLFDAIKANGYKWNAETKTLEKLPKFKVGDRIKSVISSRYYTVVDIKNNIYFIESAPEKYPYQVSFEFEINYELVPDKFDITTLVPFESRVLVRDGNTEKWKSNFWGFYDIDNAMKCPYECYGCGFAQCIPYENNEHLLGKTDDCDDFYKTWQ